ncbi:hypothetical protein [Achromobacter sp. NFACC18-2]|uniref:hypothetical protein n=1 Tax=Achromobacter sp. NFACC18-2 TaxID=1564112 RepID=UPI0008ADC4AE|nr:hypothetical protein [Achromobacter sp. NFACC18-2]SEK10255.1 hypothetical protein SAMN03159494_05285 [Achromobacter sp. NFACC18-2]
MRKILTGLAWMLAAAAPAWAAPDAAEQAQYDSFVIAAGASNGAARACGASEPDLAQHQDTARKNLMRYADEYQFAAGNYDALFKQGQAEGKTMMDDMKRSGVDGCRGVLGGFQSERVMTYEGMKRGFAEVGDGLPGEKAR